MVELVRDIRSTLGYIDGDFRTFAIDCGGREFEALMHASDGLPLSTARFANVAFSDGSLLHGFNQRFAKRQPISAPNDVRRYFVTPQESGELCLMSCLLGENRDIFFPKLSEHLHLTTFSDIAVRYLNALGRRCNKNFLKDSP